jgi:hypothetical protein
MDEATVSYSEGTEATEGRTFSCLVSAASVAPE